MKQIIALSHFFIGGQKISHAKREARYNDRRVQFIDKFLPKNGIGAELGVFKGVFSPYLLERTTAKKLHLIDPWYLFTSEWHWSEGDKSTVNALIAILGRFKKDIDEGRILVHVGFDTEVLKSFPDGYLDWVYIDSSHKYEHTREELQILEKKIKRNGVIAGDDWHSDPAHMHHGVCKAVTEFVDSSEYRILYSDTTDKQWAIMI